MDNQHPVAVGTDGELKEDTQPHRVLRKPLPYDEPPRDQSSGCFNLQTLAGGCLIGCGSPLVLLTLVAMFVVVTGVNTIGGLADSIRDIFSPDPATANITSTQTLITRVQPLGQLVSVNVQLAKADIRVEVRDGFQNACGRTAYHVAQGIIEAGVDLTQLDESDIQQDLFTGDYTINLPAPRLTSCNIDVIQYSRSTSACGPNWETLRRLAEHDALVDLRDDVIEGGILERARDEAQLTLRNFLELATGETITVTFEAPAEPVFPATCEPRPVAGWRYDERSASWVGD